MKKRVLLLYNTVAGTGAARHRLDTIVETLSACGCLVTVYPVIPSRGLVSEDVIRTYGSSFDVIACCGGDGTLNHVLNAVMSCGIDAPIGYIPSGSTNDFSRNINGDAGLEELCEAIAGDKTFDYDIGRLNSTYFNYVAGFGAFTDVSYTTDQNIKNLIGYGAYVLKVITSLPQNIGYSTHVRIEHDGITEEGDYIFCGVTNSISLAGVRAPFLEKSSLNDGLFEVMLIRAPQDLSVVNDVLATLTGGSTNNEYVHIFKTGRVRFISDREIAWTVDGENGGLFKEADIKVLPAAVRIMSVK